MADCRDLALEVARWGGAVVPARVTVSDGSWHKGSLRGWPGRASSDPSAWPDGWFTWGGDWWVGLVPKVCGLVALDLDGPEAVDLFRRAVRSEPHLFHGPPLAYRTPGHGGGMHAVWRWPAALPPFSRRVVTLAPGAQVDLRGEATFTLLCGAPRPDLPDGARYELVSRPGSEGPPHLPDGLHAWMESLGDVNVEAAPSLGVKQLDPAELERRLAASGGKVTADRHLTLFRLASHLRVRRGTRTFESLATELWRIVEAHFEIEGEEEHWQSEVIRVARNASRYVQQRDEAQAEAARAMAAALHLPVSAPRSS